MMCGIKAVKEPFRKNRVFSLFSVVKSRHAEYAAIDTRIITIIFVINLYVGTFPSENKLSR